MGGNLCCRWLKGDLIETWSEHFTCNRLCTPTPNQLVKLGVSASCLCTRIHTRDITFWCVVLTVGSVRVVITTTSPVVITATCTYRPNGEFCTCRHNGHFYVPQPHRWRNGQAFSSRVRQILGSHPYPVKPKTINLVFVASPLSTHH